MMKKLVHLLVIAFLLGTPVTSIAQEAPDKYAGREHLRIDHDKLKTLSRDERRAYMREMKQAREDWARENGRRLETDGRFVPQAGGPRKVAAKQQLRVPGTNITYDTGTVVGTAGLASQMLGNRFDSALNPAGTMCCFPVESSGSITMITFDMVATFFGSHFWSLYSDIMGTTAMQVTSMALTGVATGLNTFSVMSPTTANAYMNGAFLAGIWQGTPPTSTALALDTGSTGGQGFHAISINDGTTATGLATVTTGAGGGVNAIFRVSGNVATPVELMRFEIEE